MKVYLAADHGGYKLKEEVKKWLKEWRYSFDDFGPDHFDSKDDYPDFAWPAAVRIGREPRAKGIFVCRSGQGMCIVANKAKGARAAVCWNQNAAHFARNDDDANILCLPGDYVTLDNAKKIVHTFLTTDFEKHARFERRVGKVKKIDINL
ncbi:MAG: RpiB/LacA/LacB family sugar-phosphate isomerase [Acidobacteriaceae bacterium]